MPITTAKQSFLNAGYTQADVNDAALKLHQKYPAGIAILKDAVTKPQKKQEKPLQTGAKEKAAVRQQAIGAPKKPKSKKWLYIILAVVSVFILIGAAILGLYWDSFFG